MAALGRGAQELVGAVDSALASLQPLIELDRPRLLEEIDDRVRVRAEGEAGAGVGERAGGADPVGEVALGGRTQAAGGCGRAERGDVALAEVSRVDGRKAIADARIFTL